MDQRFAIVGNSGSGKSTLAKKIAATGSLDILDLDTIAWEASSPTELRASECASKDIKVFCESKEAWLIEGCYANLVRASFEYKPRLIFLNPGLEQCLMNCRQRPWEPHKYASKSEQDKNLNMLLQWVQDYYQRAGDLSHMAHQLLFDEYDGPKQLLTTQRTDLSWLQRDA